MYLLNSKRLGVLLLLMPAMTGAQNAGGFLCVADKSTGFAFNRSTSSWDYARYDVKNAKYVLSLNDGQWLWKKVGSSTGLKCYPFTDLGYTQCLGFTEVTFNRNNLRYMAVYRVGYVQGGISGNEGADEPNIEIGRCTKL